MTWQDNDFDEWQPVDFESTVLHLACPMTEWNVGTNCLTYATDGCISRSSKSWDSAEVYRHPHNCLPPGNIVSLKIQMVQCCYTELVYMNTGDKIFQTVSYGKGGTVWSGLVASTHLAPAEKGFSLWCLQDGRNIEHLPAVFATTFIDGIYWVVRANWGATAVTAPIHTTKVHAGAIVVGSSDKILYVFNTDTNLINTILLEASQSEPAGTVSILGSNRPFNALNGAASLLFREDILLIGYTEATIGSGRLECVPLPVEIVTTRLLFDLKTHVTRIEENTLSARTVATRMWFGAATIHHPLTVYLKLQMPLPWDYYPNFAFSVSCGGAALQDTIVQHTFVDASSSPYEFELQPEAVGLVWCKYQLEGDDANKLRSILPPLENTTYVAELSRLG